MGQRTAMGSCVSMQLVELSGKEQKVCSLGEMWVGDKPRALSCSAATIMGCNGNWKPN